MIRFPRAAQRLKKLLCALPLLLALAQPSLAATSETYESTPVTARLITAQNGVPAGSATLSAGLDLILNDGWKTYWRSPGEVGIPPEIDWSGSVNVAEVEMLWPAPKRFTAFGIENFGYSEGVVFPLNVTLENPGAPAVLNGSVNLLVCSAVCVPETFDLSLPLATGSAIDQDSAARIGTYLAQVPVEGDKTGVSLANVSLDEAGTALTVEIESVTAFQTPDVFVELGDGTALGKPDIRLGTAGTYLWAQIPILRLEKSTYQDPVVTVTDGARAFTLSPDLITAPPAPPFSIDQLVPGLDQLAWIALVAFLGGLILNIMPCVLPVLSIKLSSAIKTSGRGTRAVRAGFLLAAAGVMAFMWALAAVLYLLQTFGVTVGWGLQFQNPTFLAVLFVVLAVFSANLFGLFEFRLPASLQTRLAGAGGTTGYGADFATGFFGAVLATPCSAPFLGTAVAFALAGRGIDIVIVFTALGLGLALPYLVVAALPGLVRVLPKPGPWMVWLKVVLGLLLLGTALWLLWVLASVAGMPAAATVAGLSVALILVVTFRVLPPVPRSAAIIVLAILPLVAAAPLARQAQPASQSLAGEQIAWVPFDRTDIAKRVSRGEVVFLDITAEWCLTCKANKALVIEREPVVTALTSGDIIPMQADWTRPDDRIARFLEAHNRFGIPFNAVYGPAAPEGIILSEILSSQDVMAAFDAARGKGALSSVLEVEN